MLRRAMAGGGIGASRARACRALIALLGALLAIGGATATASSRPPRVATVQAASALPRLHIQLTFSYRVVGGVDKIRGFTFTGLPITGLVTVRCLGGCFTRRLVKNDLNWPEAVRFVRRRTYHAGQRLVFTFSDPSYSSSTFVLKMIYNSDPRLSVFKPRHHHKHRHG